MALSQSQQASRLSRRRYLRAPVPVHFPVEERVPESATHRLLLNLLWESARRELGGRALVCADQFLYWDPTDPGKRLAPDLAVRMGARAELPASWKTWERGAPHVGVEIVSDWDTSTTTTEQKLERYRNAGVAEVVRFDPKDEARPLRFWDLIEGDLVERDPADPQAHRSDELSLYWLVVRDEVLGLTLRLARDPEGKDLVLTPEEAERAAKEAALARVAELEAELARKG